MTQAIIVCAGTTDGLISIQYDPKDRRVSICCNLCGEKLSYNIPAEAGVTHAPPLFHEDWCTAFKAIRALEEGDLPLAAKLRDAAVVELTTRN